MKVTFADQKISSIKSPFFTFAYGVHDDAQAESFLARFAGDLLDQYKKRQEFKVEKGKSLAFISTKNPVQFCYTQVIDNEAEDLFQTMRNWGAAARLQAEKSQVEAAGMYVDEWVNEELLQAWIEGFRLAGYSYQQYKKKEKKATVKEVVLHVSADQEKELKKADAEAKKRVAGVELARELVNTPANDMRPSVLAEHATQIAEKSRGKIDARIYSREECEEMGMGSYLAVAQGSEEPPKFIHLTYKGSGEALKKIAVVGKGVTFDSGGLSLKPAKYMEDMKVDMAGSAAVLGLFETLSKLNLPLEVHGVIAATENMPSGTAIRPGDVVRASDGTSIEILNTDAEGRLTLADALVFIQKENPDVIIDLATLTGACVVALGEEIAAMYTSDEQLADDLLEASKEAGEHLWHMPLHASYDKLLDSKIADVRNISTSPYGGSITAALFLKRFVKDEQTWAHIDIAGPAYAEKSLNPYTQFGATGYGVATLTHYLEMLAADSE